MSQNTVQCTTYQFSCTVPSVRTWITQNKYLLASTWLFELLSVARFSELSCWTACLLHQAQAYKRAVKPGLKHNMALQKFEFWYSWRPARDGNGLNHLAWRGLWRGFLPNQRLCLSSNHKPYLWKPNQINHMQNGLSNIFQEYWFRSPDLKQ